jgi:sporulation protein YlmC with PRC-barrel domain
LRRITNQEEILMHAKLIISGLVAATMLTPALAQTDRPANPGATSETRAAPRAHAAMWRASQLVGLDIYNEQNEKLGDVSEVLLDKSGKVAGIVIGVGGFLGIGKRDIMVEMSKLKFVDEPVRAAGDRSKTTGAGDRATGDGDRRTRSDDRRWYPDHAVLIGAGDKESVKKLPEFKYD